MIESKLLSNCGGFISGKWVAATSKATIAVHDPATGEHLADIPNMGQDQTTQAVEAAAKALSSPPSIEQRKHWLSEIARLLVENKKEMARIITREQGKPLKESEVEVDYSAGFFRFFAAHLNHLNPEKLPERPRQMGWTIHRRPAGVAA